ELCDLEARLLQFLVINPRYDSRCAAKVLASTRHVKEHCGSRIRYMRCHNICIYIYQMNVKPILRLYDSRQAQSRRTTARALLPPRAKGEEVVHLLMLRSWTGCSRGGLSAHSRPSSAAIFGRVLNLAALR